MNRTRIAGLAAVVGGLAVIADLTFRHFGDLERTYYLLAFVMGLCLPGAPAMFGVATLTSAHRSPAQRSRPNSVRETAGTVR